MDEVRCERFTKTARIARRKCSQVEACLWVSTFESSVLMIAIALETAKFEPESRSQGGALLYRKSIVGGAIGALAK